MCLAQGGVGGEGGEWMRGLGLDFTNPVGTWGVLDVCFGCGGVGGEWVAGLDQGWKGGPGICVLCLADTGASKVHPVFNLCVILHPMWLGKSLQLLCIFFMETPHIYLMICVSVLNCLTQIQLLRS